MTRASLLVLLVGCATAVVCLRGSEARQIVREIYYRHWLGTPLLKEVARTSVPCESIPADRAMRILIIGQSNAANFSNRRSSAAHPVYEFFDGRCYRAVDPLIGADGEGGSLWVTLGDLLIARNQGSAVVLMPVAIAGTAIARWAPDGDLHQKIMKAILDARIAKMRPTHVIWYQGERDAALGTSEADYLRHLQSIITVLRSEGVQAPMYISLATYCQGRTSAEVRRAQASAGSTLANVSIGVDSDRYVGALYRHDDCHLSFAGVQALAEEWLRIIGPTASRSQ